MEAIREPCTTSIFRRGILDTKIKNKDVYVDYGVTEDIAEYACSFRQYEWRFDRIELK